MDIQEATSAELLEELKREYCDGNMSVLIGAGFSKNAIESFPSWDELLAPIAEELYGYEIEQRITQGVKSKSHSKREGIFSERRKAAVYTVLQEKGYLETVSDYIRRKGIGHEAIDSYIEQYIKPVQYDKSKKGVWLYGGEECNPRFLETHIALMSCDNFRNFYTTNYDNLLEAARELLPSPQRISVVKSEVELSDTSAKHAIIKLHGDITTSSMEKYEFDGDKNLKYIISKEDYDTYLRKHEGFSFMMRLAMLTGRLCLIGFSGSDPNYKMWLQWMKDVLDKTYIHESIIVKDVVTPTEKGREIEETDTGKRIYMITATDKEADDAEKLFNKNHHVGIINLNDKQVLELITDREKGSAIDKKGDQELSYADKLQLLFGYLKEAAKHEQEQDINEDENASDKKYSALWKQAYECFEAGQSIQTVSHDIEMARHDIEIPSGIMYQDAVIRRFVHSQQPIEEAHLVLLAQAIRDVGTLPRYYRSVITGTDVLKSNPVWLGLLKKERLFSNEEADYEDEWLNIMHAAYNFDFESMYQLLTAWKPEKRSQLPKQWMLLSLFKDGKRYVELLDRYIQEEPEGSNKWNSCVRRNILSQDKVRYRIQEKTKGEFSPTISRIKRIAGEVDEIKKDIQPYGMITRSMSISNGNPPYEKSLRVLSLLCDTAYMPNIHMQNLIPEADWYDVFRNLYLYFPYPVLYYSIFYSTGKIVRRIGQDIAYSEELYNQLPEILRKLLRAVNMPHTPYILEKGILTIAKELYVAVKDREWYDLFFQNVLPVYIREVMPNASRLDGWTPNICAALENLEEVQHVNEVFVELMRNYDVNPEYVTILCVDYLPVNLLDSRETKVSGIIRKIVKDGTMRQYGSVYYILHYYKKLSKRQIEQIAWKIEKEDLSFLKNTYPQLLHVAYMAQTKKQQDIIKGIVCSIDNIWDCGISESNWCSVPQYLNLSEFPQSYKWTKQEKAVLLENMQINVSKLEHVSVSPDGTFIGSYLGLLKRMHYFVRTKFGNRSHVSKQIQERIQALIRKWIGSNSSVELLLSNDYDILLLGFDYLLKKIKLEGLSRCKEEIECLLIRAYMGDQTQFQTIISILRYITDEYPETIVATYQERLISIFRVSDQIDYTTMDLNLAMVYRDLSQIASVMIQYGVSDKLVKAWATDPMKSRFNKNRINVK